MPRPPLLALGLWAALLLGPATPSAYAADESVDPSTQQGLRASVSGTVVNIEAGRGVLLRVEQVQPIARRRERQAGEASDAATELTGQTLMVYLAREQDATGRWQPSQTQAAMLALIQAGDELTVTLRNDHGEGFSMGALPQPSHEQVLAANAKANFREHEEAQPPAATPDAAAEDDSIGVGAGGKGFSGKVRATVQRFDEGKGLLVKIDGIVETSAESSATKPQSLVGRCVYLAPHSRAGELRARLMKSIAQWEKGSSVAIPVVNSEGDQLQINFERRRDDAPRLPLR